MDTLLVLNKNTFAIIAEKKIINYKFIQPQQINENAYTEIIDLIKDLVELNNLLKPSDDYVTMKLDTGKVIIYRQNPKNNLAVVLICEKKSYKKQSLFFLTIPDALITEGLLFLTMPRSIYPNTSLYHC